MSLTIFSGVNWVAKRLFPEIARYLAFCLLPIVVLVGLDLVTSNEGGVVLAAVMILTNVAWLFIYLRAKKMYRLEIQRLSKVRHELLHKGQTHKTEPSKGNHPSAESGAHPL